MAEPVVCPAWESVLSALHGEASGEEAERLRAHASSCPVCSRLAKVHSRLAQVRSADLPPSGGGGGCPSLDALAAYAAGGDLEPAARESMESHLAACDACREAAVEACEVPGPVDVPSRLLGRVRATLRSAFGWRAKPSTSAVRPGPAGARGVPAWKILVPLAAAAGLLGGLIGARVGSPPPAPAGAPSAAAAKPSALPSPDVVAALVRGQAAIEARAAALERRLAERAPADASAAAELKALESGLDGIRKDLAALEVKLASASVPAAPAAPPTPPPDLVARVDRLQEDLGRLQGDLAAVRQAQDAAGRELAEARQAQAQVSDQVRRLQDRTSPVAAAAPAPDYEGLFAAARQGSKEEFQQSIEVLRSQGLDVLGFAVAYYCKDAAKERRALAGDELTRRGAKGVDHDLVLALAHDQLPVRREAAVLLAKYRTRGQDFGFNPSGAAEDRHRALLRAVRWWENEYRDEYAERAQFLQGATVVVPATGTPPLKPPATPPATAPAPAPVPPQYNPPK